MLTTPKPDKSHFPLPGAPAAYRQREQLLRLQRGVHGDFHPL